MRLAYQVATPDVTVSPSVTSYQGDFEECIASLASMGYRWVELMSRDPREIDLTKIQTILIQYQMSVAMVCTGECFGQDGLMLVSRDPSVREHAFQRTCELIDFASSLGAGVNIGRLRGHYYDDIPKNETYMLAVEILRKLGDYAASRGVTIVLEPVTMLQTNFINSTKEGIDLVKSINHPNFRLMVDIYHSNIEDPNLYDALRMASPVLSHIHIADNNRRIPGTCGFDFPQIIETLRGILYSGVLSIEMFQIPDQETCARESAQYLLPLLGEQV